MKNRWYFDSTMEYPNNKNYSPKQRYPEYPYAEEVLQPDGTNQVYEAVRAIFIEEKLDKQNIGLKEWNPLGEYIAPGDTVLLKPNLVNHINPCEEDRQKGLDCMITHPSLVRVIFDYVYIALKGKGKIIIADAPIQGCDFGQLLDNSGYGVLFQYIKKKETESLEISVADLRDTVIYLVDGNKRQRENSNKQYGSVVVDLKDDSYFFEIRNKKKLRVTDYAAQDTIMHHNKGKNEYCVSRAILEADIVINLVKPKTHRIAGFTAALKNMIGINTRKEYLPHHRCGRYEKGGDEYKGGYKVLKFINSKSNDVKNWALKYQKDVLSDIANNFSRMIGVKLDRLETNREKFGFWYGNDTIWRTILDVNHIVFFCDKKGIMCRKKQRKILHFGDMVVSGEKEGPLHPSYKKVGGILFSDNPVAFDMCVVKLMGFDYKKFPVLVHALQDKYLFEGNGESDIKLKSNSKLFCNELKSIKKNFSFQPSNGWKEYL